MSAPPQAPSFSELIRVDRLRYGWARVWRANGSFGGDGQTVAEFRLDVHGELGRLQRELAERRYTPRALRSYRIPKPDGSQRRLLIPAVRDRVVQQAALSQLAPWLDLRFESASWAYRRGRSHTLALSALRRAWRSGYRWMAEGDIDHFFDRIDRAKLATLLDESVPDHEIVSLLLTWVGGRTGRGIPQGAPVSPVLSNLYLDRFDEDLGLDGRRLVRFADDFVVATRSAQEAADALVAARRLLGAVGLQLRPDKTGLRSPSEGVIFLGSTLRDGALSPIPRTSAQPAGRRGRRERGDGWDLWLPKKQRDAFRRGATSPIEAKGEPSVSYPSGSTVGLIAVSALRDLVHCPHAAYRRLCLAENPETPLMRRGQEEHRAQLLGRVDTEVPVHSRQLGVIGRIDLVEWRNGHPVVVELKSGRARRPTQADRMQLCAYALAAGNSGTLITAELAFTASQRREPVALTDSVVIRTRLLLRQLHDIRDGRWVPSGRRRPACGSCRFRAACQGE